MENGLGGGGGSDQEWGRDDQTDKHWKGGGEEKMLESQQVRHKMGWDEGVGG